MEAIYLDRPLNFAHRGACKVAPENTLAAFQAAVQLGAEGIEFDVQFSKDKELVVIHDFVLQTKTNGLGPVAAKTLAELKDLDAGMSFSEEFAGERIPTLQEVFDAVGDALLLNIELKSQSLSGEGLAEATVELVEKNHLTDRVVVSSFQPFIIDRVRKLNPRVPTGLLYSPDMNLILRKAWLRWLVRPWALHPQHDMVDEAYMAWARRQGYRVHIWTADEPEELRRLVRCGVDIVITNRPDLFGQVLRGE